MILGRAEDESEVRLGSCFEDPCLSPGPSNHAGFSFIVYLLFIYSFIHLFVHSLLKESSTLQGIEVEDPDPGDPGDPGDPAFPFMGE